MSEKGNAQENFLAAAFNFARKHEKPLAAVSLVAIGLCLLIIAVQITVLETKLHNNTKITNKTQALLQDVTACLRAGRISCPLTTATTEAPKNELAVATTQAAVARNRGTTSANATAG